MDDEQKYPSVNVFDEPLESCSEQPLTGFFRDGCCNSGPADAGSHTVCVEVTEAFLEFSRFRGNDLSTPRPELAFPGLKAGDRWCLCAVRWLEAYQHGMAPRVFLAAYPQAGAGDGAAPRAARARRRSELSAVAALARRPQFAHHIAAHGPLLAFPRTA